MITEKVAKFVVTTNYQQIQPEVIDRAKNAVLDFLGVTLAGSLETGSKLIAEYAKEVDSKPEAGIIGNAFKASAPIAALANGTAAHSLDYDDTCSSWPGHPTAVTLPAVLALGEKYRRPGKQILEAYIIGVEVGSKIGLAVGRHIRRIGWHTTGTIGSIAAAAAAAKLLSLNPQQTRTAFGISASLAAGLAQNFGTMTKPLHAGNGARNGVIGALLAEKGFTANENILEEKQGFCNVLGGATDYQLDANQLGNPWEFMASGVGFKPYPSCRGTHCAIDAALMLRKEHNFSPDDIASVECIIGPMQAQILLYPRAKTGLQGKFSVEYCVSVALLEGEVQLRHFADEEVLRPEVQKLLSKAKRTIPSGLDAATLDYPQTVVVKLQDGREYSRTVMHNMSRGSPENPMTVEELRSKYTECARLVLKPQQAEQALSLVSNLESLQDISQLMEIVT